MVLNEHVRCGPLEQVYVKNIYTQNLLNEISVKMLSLTSFHLRNLSTTEMSLHVLIPTIINLIFSVLFFLCTVVLNRHGVSGTISEPWCYLASICSRAEGSVGTHVEWSAEHNYVDRTSPLFALQPWFMQSHVY